jgi:hypothetical protein
MVEMYLSNLLKAMHRSQQSMKQQVPENIQYLNMYVLGLLKSPFLAPRAI